MILSKIFKKITFKLKGKIQYISFEDKWNLFNIFIENPFKTWWKAKKLFKRPKTKVSFFWSKHDYYIPGPYIWTERYGKILDVHISDLWWKDKWDSPRYERPPHIFVCFFKKFGFNIIPHIYKTNEFGEKENGDMYYWEYLLNYTEYNRSLKLNYFWVGDSQICKNDDKPYRIPIYTHLFSLNKEGLKVFKSLYNK